MTAVVSHQATVKKSPPITPQYYKELVDKASSYNSRIVSERKLRLPYIDSQTGLAQNNSTLWHPYGSRCPGGKPGQIYAYPAKRWKKKKRSFPLPDVRLTKLSEVETGEADMHQISAVENPAVVANINKEEGQQAVQYDENYPYQTYYDEWEETETLDAGEIDTRHSDSSDFEDTYIKKKKKKKSGLKISPQHKGGRGRKKDMVDRDDSDKPFSCEQCGARYKTRPGLSYHVNHSHSNAKKKESTSFRDREQSREREREREREHSRSSTEFTTQMIGPLDDEPASPEDPYNGKTRSTGRSAGVAAPATATPSSNQQNEISKYCDFCLGDATENKKTGTKEELVSCADCGRSGHPSCLQFTANMIISVKKYPWQCIECKSCGLCGTSDNDDQLLFCDDCDRGYHMYCLKPPLSEPPEGSWSCHLCIIEFYGGKKPDNGQADTVSL